MSSSSYRNLGDFTIRVVERAYCRRNYEGGGMNVLFRPPIEYWKLRLCAAPSIKTMTSASGKA